MALAIRNITLWSGGSLYSDYRNKPCSWSWHRNLVRTEQTILRVMVEKEFIPMNLLPLTEPTVSRMTRKLVEANLAKLKDRLAC